MAAPYASFWLALCAEGTHCREAAIASRGPGLFARAVAALLLTAACSSSSTSGSEESAGRWQPEPGTTWQWQLSGTLDLSVDAEVYDVDAFDTGAATVDELHDRGVETICYLNTGAWEDFREDADDFPEQLLGKELDGWEGERWLDIRQLDELRPLMAERLDMCAEKGFDAVEPDNMDGYANDTGFDLTEEDQLAYNRMIAEMAHERGLAVGLKNDVEQVPELVDDFDFAVNEECYAYDECESLTPFIDAGKAVFHVEYEVDTDEFCPTTTALGLSSMAKHLDLDAWREAC